MQQEPTEKERFTILLEEMRGHFKLLAEGQLSIRQEMNQRFDQVDERFERLETKVDNIERIVRTNTGDISWMKKVASDHEHRVIKLETVCPKKEAL